MLATEGRVQCRSKVGWEANVQLSLITDVLVTRSELRGCLTFVANLTCQACLAGPLQTTAPLGSQLFSEEERERDAEGIEMLCTPVQGLI
jgi:hypothetical protein